MKKTGTETQTKQSLTIVGSGRLGTALATALASSNYDVTAVVARSSRNARQAAALLGQKVMALPASQIGKLPPSDIVIIATPDDVIENTARALAALPQIVRRPGTAFHTSGALSSAALSPLAAVGYQVGSIHPLVSISGRRSSLASLRGAFYCVEGTAPARHIARKIVRALEGQSFSVDSVHKPLYHAAAVLASGHLVALFDLSIETLVNCGLSREKARQVLLPLVQTTVQNLSRAVPSQALTGTFARGDIATLRKHLTALSSIADQDALDTYKLLGLRSLLLAKTKGVNPSALKLMNQLLETASSHTATRHRSSLRAAQRQS